MVYCSSCGVEVEARLERCPLCRGHLQTTEPVLKSPYPMEPDPPPQLRIPGRRIRVLMIEVLTVLMFGTLFGVLAIDYLMNDRLTWAAYCAPALAAGWWYAWLILFMTNRPAWLLGGGMLTTTLLLAGVDVVAGGFNWFFPLALPIMMTLSLVIAGVIWIACFVRTSWANITALILLGIGIFCFVLNLIVSLQLHGAPLPTWSLPVLGSLVPPALFLLYVHYRLSKVVDLGKIFHL